MIRYLDAETGSVLQDKNIDLFVTLNLFQGLNTEFTEVLFQSLKKNHYKPELLYLRTKDVIQKKTHDQT